jgi:hypothetical protein
MRVNVSNVTVEKIASRNADGLLANADDSICGLRTTNPALSLLACKGVVELCTFRNVDTGAVVVEGGELEFSSVSFVNNTVYRDSKYPNLRHNIYASNGTKVQIRSVQVDSGDSNFIYASDDGSGVEISGVSIPLFVPFLTSLKPSELSEDETTTFVFTGTGFFPCGLKLKIRIEPPSKDFPSDLFDMEVQEETIASITLSNSLFAENGHYYASVIYGPNLSLSTLEKEMLVMDKEEPLPKPPDVIIIEPEGQKGMQGQQGLIVGICIAVVAVVAVVVIVIGVLVVRYRLKKRLTTESKTERIGMREASGVEVTKILTSGGGLDAESVELIDSMVEDEDVDDI